MVFYSVITECFGFVGFVVQSDYVSDSDFVKYLYVGFGAYEFVLYFREFVLLVHHVFYLMAN